MRIRRNGNAGGTSGEQQRNGSSSGVADSQRQRRRQVAVFRALSMQHQPTDNRETALVSASSCPPPSRSASEHKQLMSKRAMPNGVADPEAQYNQAGSSQSQQQQQQGQGRPPRSPDGDESIPMDADFDELDKSKYTIKQLAKYQLRHFLRTTTFHGLDQVFTSGSWFTRVFWGITICLVFAVVFVQIRKLLIYFVENPSLTSIDVVYPENGIKVPSVTLCMLSKLNRTKVSEQYPKMSKLHAELSMSSFLSAYSTALMDVYYFKGANITLKELEREMFAAIGERNISDFIYDTTFTCENQFLVCWFENGIMFDCCKPNDYMVVKRYMVHSGACFEFENQNKSQRLPGPVGGFGFVYWYPNDHIYRTAYNSYNEHAVHMYMSPVDAMLENNPISLPVGYHSHINLLATQAQRLMVDELGRARCIPKKLKYFNEYSYQACQVECLVDMMIKECNCTGIADYASIPQHLVCSPAHALKCYESLAEHFSNLLVKCRQERCEEACNYWTYRASLTVSRVFNPLIEEQMLKYWRLPKGDPSQSLIITDVYFGEIQYTKVTQMPALTIEGFVSSIGGAMGLWTGASIITWIHLLYFCCALCFYKRSPVRFQAETLYAQAESRLSSSRSSPRKSPPQQQPNTNGSGGGQQPWEHHSPSQSTVSMPPQPPPLTTGRRGGGRPVALLETTKSDDTQSEHDDDVLVVDHSITSRYHHPQQQQQHSRRPLLPHFSIDERDQTQL